MSVIKVPTTFNIDVEFEIPEFYRRLISLLIDVLILLLLPKIAGKIFENICRHIDDTGSTCPWLNIMDPSVCLSYCFGNYHERPKCRKKNNESESGQ